MGISRREADDAIAAGKVTVDAKKAELGARIDIDKNPNVCYNGKMVSLQAGYLYVALNKPRGVVCSKKSQDGGKVLHIILLQAGAQVHEQFRVIEVLGLRKVIAVRGG